MKPAIEATNLTKKFKFTLPHPDSSYNSMWLSFLASMIKRRNESEIVALDNVSFKVNYGEIFCIVGPNGAGKTTLLKILSTILIPDKGTAFVNGFDVLEEPDEVKASITVIPGTWWITLDWRLTVKENLIFWARLFGYSKNEAEERANYALSLMNLNKFENSYPTTLSSGYRQRVAIARGLVVDSPIFLLDEPTISLDPISAEGFREFVKGTLSLKLKRTIVWTTHVLSEAEKLGDRIGIMKRGKFVTCDSLKNLISNVNLDTLEVTISGINADSLEEKIAQFKKSFSKNVVIRLLSYTDGITKIKVAGANRECVEKTISLCLDNSQRILEVNERRPSLEEVFTFYAGDFQ
ncbi:MAG: ABC transporter ATP-binding protein [Thermoproteota archaeon]